MTINEASNTFHISYSHHDIDHLAKYEDFKNYSNSQTSTRGQHNNKQTLCCQINPLGLRSLICEWGSRTNSHQNPDSQTTTQTMVLTTKKPASWWWCSSSRSKERPVSTSQQSPSANNKSPTSRLSRKRWRDTKKEKLKASELQTMEKKTPTHARTHKTQIADLVIDSRKQGFIRALHYGGQVDKNQGNKPTIHVYCSSSSSSSSCNCWCSLC